MSRPASSGRRLRPAQSDVYTWLLLLAALFMIAANVILAIPLNDWYHYFGE
mgnify:CR=1 FL=1